MLCLTLFRPIELGKLFMIQHSTKNMKESNRILNFLNDQMSIQTI